MNFQHLHEFVATRLLHLPTLPPVDPHALEIFLARTPPRHVGMLYFLPVGSPLVPIPLRQAAANHHDRVTIRQDRVLLGLSGSNGNARGQTCYIHLIKACEPVCFVSPGLHGSLAMCPSGNVLPKQAQDSIAEVAMLALSVRRLMSAFPPLPPCMPCPPSHHVVCDTPCVMSYTHDGRIAASVTSSCLTCH